jgi:hypothetical protein
MKFDPENFSDREDAEDAAAVARNRLARARGPRPIEHEEAKRLLREVAAKAAAGPRGELTADTPL